MKSLNESKGCCDFVTKYAEAIGTKVNEELANGEVTDIAKASLLAAGVDIPTIEEIAPARGIEDIRQQWGERKLIRCTVAAYNEFFDFLKAAGYDEKNLKMSKDRLEDGRFGWVAHEFAGGQAPCKNMVGDENGATTYEPGSVITPERKSTKLWSRNVFKKEKKKKSTNHAKS